MQNFENRRTYDVCIIGSCSGGGMAARAPLEMRFVGRKWKTAARAKE